MYAVFVSDNIYPIGKRRRPELCPVNYGPDGEAMGIFDYTDQYTRRSCGSCGSRGSLDSWGSYESLTWRAWGSLTARSARRSLDPQGALVPLRSLDPLGARRSLGPLGAHVSLL